MFERTQCKHPFIVLKDIKDEDLEALLNYMYIGEVNVLQDKLSGLIKAAECLKIKGLAVPDEAPDKEPADRANKRGVNRIEESPQPKRRRRDDGSLQGDSDDDRTVKSGRLNPKTVQKDTSSHSSDRKISGSNNNRNSSRSVNENDDDRGIESERNEDEPNSSRSNQPHVPEVCKFFVNLC